MTNDRTPGPVVVKVGGSLFGMADLFSRLADFIRELDDVAIIIVPGGGDTTDVIRTLDMWHGLGEEAAHWLALRALTINAHFLAAGLGARTVVSGNVAEWPPHWEQGKVIIVDAFEFAVADESQPGRLPHGWDATSDSVAARVARVIWAKKLYLLKSTTMEPNVDWAEAGGRGYVDSTFAELIGGLSVEPISFREWTPSASSLIHERDQNR